MLEDENIGEFNEKLIEEILEAYPAKSKKKRAKHLTTAKATEAEEEGGE